MPPCLPACSNSPGGVNFESAPFKLTRELLEVLDSNSEGRASELFDYFKASGSGWLACRLAVWLAGIRQAAGEHARSGTRGSQAGRQLKGT